MWQSLKGKIDRKLSIEITLRELKKETGLIVESENFKFFLNNSNYNYNIYTLKVHPNIKLDFIKPNKNRKWKKFSFETYERMVKEGYIMPIHIIYIELIFHKIKPKS